MEQCAWTSYADPAGWQGVTVGTPLTETLAAPVELTFLWLNINTLKKNSFYSVTVSLCP